MTSHRANSSLAVAAGGLFGFVVLVSGVWHPRMDSGGLTQVGRHASVAFEDGNVLELTEPDTDLDILRRRRMAGWHGHEFQQTFIMADGREMEVTNQWSGGGDDLDSGTDLILTANDQDVMLTTAQPDRKGIVLDNVQVDAKDKKTAEVDGKDRVIEDVIDSKDRAYTDSKDVFKQPVFALSTQNPEENLPLEPLLYTGGVFANLRTAADTGIIGFGGTSTINPPGTAVTITPPGIGNAVPEPSALWLLGAGGGMLLLLRAFYRRTGATA